MMKQLLLAIIGGLLFFTSSFAQELNYELGVIDLNDTHASSSGDIQDILMDDTHTYISFGSSSEPDLFTFDGTNLELILENQDTYVWQDMGTGFLLTTWLQGYQVYFFDKETYELTLLLSMDNNIKNVASVNNGAIFSNYDGQLFFTDGTLQGTSEIFSFSDDVDFIGQTDSGFLINIDSQFWITDGTSSGTQKIIDNNDIASFATISAPINGKVFYVYSEYDSYPLLEAELFVTDGSATGTIQLTNLNPTTNGNSTFFDGFLTLENKLLFLTQTDELGTEYWTSDGTIAGTKVLQDINPGIDSGIDNIFYLGREASKNGLAFFKAESGSETSNIYCSDGSSEGTFPITNLENIENTNWDIELDIFEAPNEKMYIFTNEIEDSVSMWVYEKNAVEASHLGYFPTLPSDIVSSGTLTYLTFSSNGQRHIFATDGTIEGTLEVATYSSYIDVVGSHDNFLYFTHNNGNIGEELYISDGTVEGTKLLKDIKQGSSSSDIDHFFIFQDQAYFYAEDTELEQSIYTTDGTPENTIVAADLSPKTYGSFDLEYLTSAAGKLFFINDDTLWVSDGTTESTINLYTEVSFLEPLTLNEKLFFNSNGDTWVSDGTIQGTFLLVENVSFITDIVELYQGKIWFIKDNNIWNTDGTLEGTQTVFDEQTAASLFQSNGIGLSAAHGYLYFSNSTTDTGRELWRTDGTLEGTQLFMDIAEGSVDSSPSFLAKKNNLLYFSAKSSQFSSATLWVTDGTVENTKSINSDWVDVLKGYAFLDDTFYFFNGNGDLWKTTGTLESTELVYDFNNSSINDFTLFQNKFLFSYDDDFVDAELWISDGTTEGTKLLKDIGTTIGANPTDFTIIGDYCFFSINYNFSPSLWLTNGTTEGTIPTDFTEDDFTNAQNLAAYEGNLYFTANSPTYGTEIHYLDFSTKSDFGGLVYHDTNANGQKDEDEVGINNLAIAAESNNQTLSFSNTLGEYGFFVPENTYTVYPIMNQCWELSSDSSQYTVNTAMEIDNNFDFGFTKIEEIESVDTKIFSGPTRCGFTVPFWLNIMNTGCKTSSGEVEIDLGEFIEFVDSDTPALSTNGTSIKWAFENLAATDVLQIKLELKMPNEDFVDTQIQIPSTVSIFDENNILQTGNTATFSSIITCAIDPNDKLVEPSREEESNSNYTLTDELMTYTIRFQNTGTDTAFTVRIEDYLSSHLDYATFQPLTASHPFRSTLNANGKVEFIFENILLPDSTTNEVASHGFVSYSIQSLEDTPDFSIIDNTAGIYFDFNSPIITNTVSNTIVSTFDADEDGSFLWEDCDDFNASVFPGATEIVNNGIDEDCNGQDLTSSTYNYNDVSIRIYPNPTNNAMFIEQKGIDIGRLKVQSVSGKIIVDEIITDDRTLYLENYPNGIYILSITINETTFTEKIVKQ